MYAKINTKSNYKGLNGQWVKVLEFLGTILYCTDEFSENPTKFDIYINEVLEIRKFPKL